MTAAVMITDGLQGDTFPHSSDVEVSGCSSGTIDLHQEEQRREEHQKKELFRMERGIYVCVFLFFPLYSTNEFGFSVGTFCQKILIWGISD
ncbi:hypothetical protein CEXT_416771 [Caerostris extrusa]|uniref:Uncharacterized protein n=1 Tax=Caerostris extrusa TaxID=172846 RepID=A0AAV4V713_CAEEX|nr:hypothetical protein CEXT_416771 [Caerostris extrusa]